jgi:hypothetical protein
MEEELLLDNAIIADAPPAPQPPETPLPPESQSLPPLSAANRAVVPLPCPPPRPRGILSRGGAGAAGGGGVVGRGRGRSCWWGLQLGPAGGGCRAAASRAASCESGWRSRCISGSQLQIGRPALNPNSCGRSSAGADDFPSTSDSCYGGGAAER